MATTTVTVSNFFEPITLTTAVQTLYTVPNSPSTSTWARGRIRFTNHSGGAVTVNAYAVPSGEAAGNGNAFLVGTSIASDAYLDTDVPVLGPGDFLQALASSGASITVSQIDGILFQ